MGDIADYLVEQEMFGYDNDYRNKLILKNNKKKLTTVEKQIASIRKEIAIDAASGTPIQEARRKANLKYGKGWRERGIVVNSEDQWSEDDLKEFK